MGVLTDLLKEIPLSAVLKEKIATVEDENGALKTEVAILKDDLRKAKAEIVKLKDEIQRLTHTDDLDETSVQVLTFLAKREGNVNTDSNLAATLKTDKTRARYLAGQLEERGYISAQHHSGIMSIYNLTQKGRKYLLDKGLL